MALMSEKGHPEQPGEKDCWMIIDLEVVCPWPGIPGFLWEMKSSHAAVHIDIQFFYYRSPV